MSGKMLSQYVVIQNLAQMPVWEFKSAVRQGKIALVTKLFGLPRGNLVRRARKQRKVYGIDDKDITGF
jgi:hypothetical protein